MFDSVLIANRGEIAVRVIRACHELGVRAIAVHSRADARAMHVDLADESYELPGAAHQDGYLDIEAVVQAARDTGAQAVHPGYGFLAENADFARAVADAGLAFIGPSPEAIAAMGDKLSARAVAIAAGVPVVPGTSEPLTNVSEALAFADQFGYPVAVKAMFGGGGRGMKVVHDAQTMEAALAAAEREAVASFGRGECYLERYLQRPRHIEIQVLADDSRTLHLGDRDCSLQRRHQKLIEEAPAPNIEPEVRDAMARAAVAVAEQMGYRNAGTCEFLLDEDGRTFYFLEMNTRLQVEHPVTELVTGVDLVHEQLRIASGEGCSFRQDTVRVVGSAIEARVNAEDPANSFLPSPGTVHRLVSPDGPWTRFDTGVREGDEISPYYDSLVGKLIVWATDRDTARWRLARALGELDIAGISTTTPFHRLAVAHPQFAECEHSTKSVEQEWDLTPLTSPEPEEQHQMTTAPSGTRSNGRGTGGGEPEPVSRDIELTLDGEPRFVTVYGVPAHDYSAAAPRRVRRTGSAVTAALADDTIVRAPMHGTVVAHVVQDGQDVEAGEVVCVVEAMKMENHLTAPRAGRVRFTHPIGQVVERGETLAEIES